MKKKYVYVEFIFLNISFLNKKNFFKIGSINKSIFIILLFLGGGREVLFIFFFIKKVFVILKSKEISDL